MSVQVKGSGTIGGLDEGLNVVGVVTATTFSGSGASLTNLPAGQLTGTFTGDVTGTASNASGATGDFSIADKIIHTGDTNTAIRFPAADTISFETAGSDRIRIASDGKVLIDNSTGTFTIGGDNVYDSAKINLMIGSPSQTSATTEATAIVIHDRNSQRNGTEGAGSWKSKIAFRSTQINGNYQSEGASIVHDITYNNYSSTKMRSDLVFKTRGDAQTAASDPPAERLRINSDGKVLIGTNSTHNTNSYSNNVIIYENGDTGMSILGNNSSSNYASLYLSDTSTSTRGYLEQKLGANGDFTIGKAGTGKIRYVLNGSEKFCMTHTGRFGVGETDPDFAIHLKGSAPIIGFEDTDGTHGQAIIEQNGDELKIRQDAGNASSGTGSTILFQVDGSTKMRIDGTGYVGINRTSPTHYLDVDGTSLFRGRVFISGAMSMKSTPFGANVTYDTGISINGGGYGGSILAICSKNYGAGTNTQSGVYLLKFHYDGNTTPSVTLIAGSNLATFDKSGSNTLTVHMGASNNMFTAIESSVVNA